MRLREPRFDRLRKKDEQQQAVAEFGLRALSAVDTPTLLQDAVETAAEGLGVEYSSLLELQDGDRSMRVRAAHGWTTSAEGRVFEHDERHPAVMAWRSGEPVLLEHRVGTADDARSLFLRDHRVASSAATVIRADGRRHFGVLTVHSTRPGAFDESDVFFLRALANVVSAAVTRERSLESTRQLAAIVESSVDAVIGRTLDGTVTSWNAAAERLFGYSAGEMLGESILRLAAPEYHDSLEVVNEQLRRGELVAQFDTVRVRKDGTEIEVASTISEITDDKGQIVGASAISHDITDRRLAEAALRESETRVRAMLESSIDAVITIDHTGRILEFNPAAELIFGRRRTDVLGEEMAELLIPPSLREEHRRGIDHYRATGRGPILGKRLELSALRADGSEFPIELAITRVPVEGPPVFTGHIRDITERRALEAQVRQSQRLESVGRLAGGIAHDFNNLLTVIAGYAGVLLERKDSATEKELNEIVAAAERATILTRQLLAFSRRQVLQPRMLDLNETLEGITQMLGRLLSAQVELVLELDPALEPVMADPNQIEQVLVNLAVNAEDAMPDGGTLTITTETIELDDAYVSHHLDASAGRHVMLAVSDTGVGMEPDVVTQIFEPFFTTKPLGQGTGLGLSTVYGIVKQSGGSVRAESESGNGTTFRVYLPVATGSQPPEAVSPPKAATPSGTETILLVEDEPALLMLATRMLELHGYRILAAEGAADALRVAAGAADIDLLLTDLVMPDMGGRELADHVRELLPGIRVLFTSGYSEEAGTRNGNLERGAVCVEKPYSADDLALMVRTALDA